MMLQTVPACHTFGATHCSGAIWQTHKFACLRLLDLGLSQFTGVGTLTDKKKYQIPKAIRVVKSKF